MILQKAKRVTARLHNIHIYAFNNIKNVRMYSEYLAEGWYVCKKGQWVRTTSFFNKGVIYHKKQVRTSQNRLSKFSMPLQTSVSIYRGGWSGKYVSVYPDYVISYYDNRAEIWFQDIQKYYDDFPYAKCKLLALDFDKRAALFEKVNGTSCFDKEHVVFLAKQMLCALKKSSPIIGNKYDRYSKELAENGITDIVSCIQHGDAANKNVLWESEKDYKFIDYDSIGVFPLLYDFFRLILVDFGPTGLGWYIDGVFDEEIAELFETFEVGSLLQLKDKYLAVFYVFSHGRWVDSWANRNCLPKEYELTIRAISRVADVEENI